MNRMARQLMDWLALSPFKGNRTKIVQNIVVALAAYYFALHQGWLQVVGKLTPDNTMALIAALVAAGLKFSKEHEPGR